MTLTRVSVRKPTPGIVHLARDEQRELDANLIADAVWPVCHAQSRRLSGRSNSRRDALDDEGLDDVADLDVVVLLEADAALEARP